MIFILFGLGWPLGLLWGLWGPSWDPLWISPVGSLALEAFWGPFWMPRGLFSSSFKAFGHPLDTFFLISSITFYFTWNYFFKFAFLFITFLFYVAECDVTWSAELPEGSSFMF